MYRRIISYPISYLTKSKFIYFNEYRSTMKNIYSFSSIKKNKEKENDERNKKQQYQMKQKNQNKFDGNYDHKTNDTDKKSQNAKKLHKIKKQTINLQVPSQSQLQNSVIINQIARQRQKIQNNDEQAFNNTSPKDKRKKLFMESFLNYLTGSNVAIVALFSFPIFPHHHFWLGVLTSSVLYPSFLVINCLMVGINLAYLVLRQSLQMHTPVNNLNQVDITSAPLSYYLETALLLFQIVSLSAYVYLPEFFLTPQKLSVFTTSGIIFVFLSINFHNTFEQMGISNDNYKYHFQLVCFLIMFLLNGYILIIYQINQQQNQQKELKQYIVQFKDGKKYIQNIWKINKIVIFENQKITDILQKQDKQE